MTCDSTFPGCVRRPIVGATMLILMLLGSGCTAPKVVESWKDPSVTGPLHFKKIMVLAVHPHAGTRQAAEDELVRQIGARAIPAEPLLTAADRADPEKLKAKVKQSGADGLVTVRVQGVSTRTGSSPAFNPYAYDSFWHNSDRDLWSADRTAGATYSENVLLIRTRIFSVADEKLVWEGVTETVEPKDTQSTIGGITKAIAEHLRKQHLIE